MSEQEIKVGDKFFMFDENRRVYRSVSSGECRGGAIYREHFYEVKIDGETSRSWITRYGQVKVPKSSPFPPLYTQKMVDDAVWRHDYQPSIANAVCQIKDADMLRRVAEVIGWKEPQE